MEIEILILITNMKNGVVTQVCVGATSTISGHITDTHKRSTAPTSSF
jgi:hypothetical protein